MSFNSLQFLIFLPVILILYYILPHKLRWVLLLAASYYFYMSFDPILVFLILGTTGVSYGAGLVLERAKTVKVRRAALILTVLLNYHRE